MKTQYQKIQDEPKKLTEAEEETAGDFLWKNFWYDFHAKRHWIDSLGNKQGISRDLMSRNLRRLMFNQGANFNDAPEDLFNYMKDDDLIRHTTELYAYIQLTCKGIQTEFWPKALDQSNPYVLRYHVFALHNRMYDLIVMHKKPDDPKWKEARSSLHDDVRKSIDQIKKEDIQTKKSLLDKYPAFAHFQLGYSHYTLAIGATAEHAKEHWKEAYAQFLMAESTEKKNPKASFIVTLGQGIYKDMPFDNLEGVKAQIEEKLTADEISEIKRGLDSRLKNRGRH